MTTLLFQLREAARTEADELVRLNLKLCADELQQSLHNFTLSPTEMNLRLVNGHWIHGVKVLSYAGTRKGPWGGGALKEGARLNT